MSDVKALRGQLAEADRLRAIAAESESARVKIRLGERPIVRRGVLGFWRPSEVLPEQSFTQAETNAIYDALAKVRDDAQRRADEIEKAIAGGAA